MAGLRRLTTATSTKGPDGVDVEERKTAEDYPIGDLTKNPHNAPASVTVSLDGKVSDNVYYGGGTWDRIPYSVTAFCSVRLACEQDQVAIEKATMIATDLAWDGVRKGLAHALPKHLEHIRALYPSYFPEQT